MSRARRPQPGGFTLIELAVVAAVLAVLAALTFTYITTARNRAAASLAPKQLLQEMDLARVHAMEVGKDVALVLVGPTAPTTVTLCGKLGLAFNYDPNCVQYWIIDGIPANFAVAGGAFDPTNPLAQGGTLYETDFLSPRVYLGQAAGYTPPANPANATNIFQAVPTTATTTCSFCATTTGTAVGGFIRYTARGDAFIPAGPNTTGAVVYLTSDQTLDTRMVALLAPSGMSTDRITSLEK